MKTLGLFVLISMLLHNSILALLVILLIYLIIDRSLIGFLPDFTAPLPRKRRLGELQRELEINPHNANARMELSELHFNRSDYQRAVDHLQKVLVKMDDSALAHFYLGAALLHLGRAEGLEEMTKAITINPKVAHGYPYLYLLKYGVKEGIVPASEVLHENLLRHGSVQTFYDAGKYLRSAGQSELASKYLQEVLDIYRLSSPAMRRRLRRIAIYARLFSKP